jgi:hypothetical protein
VPVGAEGMKLDPYTPRRARHALNHWFGDAEENTHSVTPFFGFSASYIEQCWGCAKREYCKFPPSPKESDLERNVIAALDSVTLESMRKYVILCYHKLFLALTTNHTDTLLDLRDLWMLIGRA